MYLKRICLYEKVYFQIIHTHRNPEKPLQKPSELKIVVDTMVLGLGKNLRLLGFDVYIPRDVTELKEFLRKMDKMEESEQRLVISVPSRSYEMLKSDNPNAKFVLIPNIYEKVPIDLVCSFFDFFNIDISPDQDYIKLNC